jgi:hypothetical protein
VIPMAALRSMQCAFCRRLQRKRVAALMSTRVTRVSFRFRSARQGGRSPVIGRG